MLIDGLLLAVLAICVATDLKSRKIYNKVIFPGLILALGCHLALEGWDGLRQAGCGFLTGLGVLLIPYLLGGMGAGDVKLLALVGAIKGVSFVLIASVYMAMLGGIIALLFLLCRKGAVQRIRWVAVSLYSLRYGVKMPLIADREAMTATFPYGVAIAGGCVFGLWLKGWGFV